MATSGRPELRVAELWDASIENTVRKLAYGTILGALGGLFLFRAPVARSAVAGLGAGIGIGMGYTECKHEFDQMAKEQAQ
jgi:inner membrane organizing system protein 1